MLSCVRLTLILDDDVAAHLEFLRAGSGQPLEQLVNEALRAGLAHLEREPGSRQGPFTRSVSLGRPLLPTVDDVSGTLASVEDGRSR